MVPLDWLTKLRGKGVLTAPLTWPVLGSRNKNVSKVIGLLVMPALSFKVGVDALLAFVVACVPWIPQIHLWCDTCWPPGGQHHS